MLRYIMITMKKCRVENAKCRTPKTLGASFHLSLCTPHSPLNGAPGRTRTDDYEFTKLALLLLRHRGKMVSTAGVAPAASTFARWRSDLTELRGQIGIRDRTRTD